MDDSVSKFPNFRYHGNKDRFLKKSNESVDNFFQRSCRDFAWDHVILIGAGRNPERCVVVMCNQRRRYFWNLRRYGNGKTANSSISSTTLKFEDVPARNAFEYPQMIYIARN